MKIEKLWTNIHLIMHHLDISNGMKIEDGFGIQKMTLHQWHYPTKKQMKFKLIIQLLLQYLIMFLVLSHSKKSWNAMV